MRERWFCENCRTAFAEAARRCPQCGSRRVREAREDDLAGFCEKDALWAPVLEDVFRQNGVEFCVKDIRGAGMAAYVGLAGEARRFYVRLGQWPLAKALYEELFSGERGEPCQEAACAPCGSGRRTNMEYRMERDSMGEMRVPADRYWGAQTQRSYQNFPIGVERMPLEIVRAFGVLKKAAAMANHRLRPERMTAEKLDAISRACDEIVSGALDEHFPLVVWQTGSGTQSNMNANEVIANRGNELAGKKLLHPNDDVNMSQSSNDTFPTAMHVAAVLGVEDRLMPQLRRLIDTFARLEAQNADVVKSGRTHLQDATPIRFSQEISGWRGMVETPLKMLEAALPGLKRLALGGTAVGTGLNCPKGFDEAVARAISELTGKSFVTAPNKFHALTAKDELAFAHGALKALAANLMKIANDVRWLASGPRCGLGEIRIPENEPGSSIMPGKVNPTQCESLTMIAVQVMANDVAVGMAASQGNFELNVFMPVCAYNFLQSVRLLADGVASFNDRCASGIVANREKMRANLHNSLMLVTALNPYIGYDNAARTAKKAYAENISLKEACVALGYLTPEEFDAAFHPEEMA